MAIEENELKEEKPKRKPGWQKGQSGNPAGRPPNKDSPTYRLRQALKANGGKLNGQDISKLDAIVDMALNKAIAGDTEMIKYLINRIDGLPKANIEVNEHLVPKVVFIYVGDDAPDGAPPFVEYDPDDSETELLSEIPFEKEKEPTKDTSPSVE